MTLELSLKDSLTLFIALIGAILGVINTTRSFARDLPRVLVRTRQYVTSHDDSGLCIEAVNTGVVAVSVTQVALQLRKPRGYMFWFTPSPPGVLHFPQLLQPGTKLDVYLSGSAQENPQLREATRAFVRIASGKEFFGSRRPVRKYLEHFATAGKDGQ